MTLQNLLQSVSYKILQQASGGISQEISSVTHDSRKVIPYGLFICLLGLTADGHEYIDSVAKAGAAAIVVEEYNEMPMWPENSCRIYPRPPGYTGAAQKRAEYPSGVTIIQVENTRQAMALIAANLYNRPADKLTLIGVTGTNGKTSTVHFIEEMLRCCGHKTGQIGTIGARVGENHLDISFDSGIGGVATTPDPLELHRIFKKMVELGAKYVVMEVSSHALCMYRVEGVSFEVGVFTNLTQDHLDIHGTMDNYRLAKAQLFAQSRFAVLNKDDESSAVMLKHHGFGSYLTYGIDDEADLRAVHINYQPDKTVFALEDEPEGCFYELHPKGKFNIYNVLAAMGTARALGLDTINIKITPQDPRREIIRNAVSKLKGVTGRIQDVPNNQGVHILVDYAHSPDGIKNIITSVREFATGQVVIILGCGGDRDKTKRPQMGRIAGELADYCILTSDNPRTENPLAIIADIEEGIKPTGTSYETCENRRDAIFIGVKMLSSGDALIIAGKGHEDYQIIGTEKHDFSDYEIAVKALGAI